MLVGVVEVLLMLHLRHRHRRPLLAIPLPINLFLLHQRWLRMILMVCL